MYVAEKACCRWDLARMMSKIIDADVRKFFDDAVEG